MGLIYLYVHTVLEEKKVITMEKKIIKKTFLFLRNFQSFAYQKKELILFHYYIVFDF